MLEILIGSSVLIVVLALLRAALHGRIRARVQYALWGLVALRLLVPVSLFSAPVSASKVAEPIERQIVAYSSERAVTVEYPVTMGRASDTGEVVQAVARDTVEPLDVLRWVWYGGMAVTGAWFCYVNLRMARRLRKGREKLSMDSPLPVYVARGIASPCLFGLIKPAIYLTEQAAADGEAARQVVAHELTHGRQGDHIWALVRGVCLVIWWFDPLVWLAAALSRRDCELACDEGTVKALGEQRRYDYGRTLLGLATVKPSASTLLCGATTMTGGKTALAERIRSLAKPKHSVPLCIAALALAFVAAGCAFTGGAEEEDAASTPSPLPAAVSGSIPLTEEELGTYSDELWRIYDELDEFSYVAAVSLDYADETLAADYRAYCIPTAFCSFSDIVHCTDSWTAEYDVALELAETPDAQITIENKAGDALYIRSDTDNVYVRRADGTIDCYTGPGSRYMLESLWYWASALSAPETGAEITMPVVSQQLFFLLFSSTADFDPNEAAYWYCSDLSVAWWLSSDWSMSSGGLNVNYADADMNTVLAVYNEGDCYIACTDAAGTPLARWHIVGTAADAEAVTGAAYWNALGDLRTAEWDTVEIEPAAEQATASGVAMGLRCVAGLLTKMGSWNMRYADAAEFSLEQAERFIHLRTSDGRCEAWVCDNMDGVLLLTDNYTVFAETPLYTGAELLELLAVYTQFSDVVGPDPTPQPAPTAQPEEVLGTYSDDLWRIYDELDAFSYVAAVSLDCADETLAADYRAYCVPTAFCSFSDVVHCTDSWTAEYNVAAELGETPDAQITIENKAGDALYIRSDTDSVYVRRTDGTIDCYTGPDSQFMLENLWYWAAAMTAPVKQEPLTLAPNESCALSDIISSEDAVYWYVSDGSVAKIWVGEGAKAHAAGYPDVEDGALKPCGEGTCFVACTDADGNALARVMLTVSSAQ